MRSFFKAPLERGRAAPLETRNRLTYRLSGRSWASRRLLPAKTPRCGVFLPQNCSCGAALRAGLGDPRKGLPGGALRGKMRPKKKGPRTSWKRIASPKE